MLTLIRLLLGEQSYLGQHSLCIYVSPIISGVHGLLLSHVIILFLKNSVFMSMEDNTCNNNNCELPMSVNLFIYYYHYYSFIV